MPQRLFQLSYDSSEEGLLLRSAIEQASDSFVRTLLQATDDLGLQFVTGAILEQQQLDEQPAPAPEAAAGD